jgi:peptide/nickel transport system substrate-binding protein
MKPDIRWQLLLAVTGFGLVLALLTFQVQTAGLCSVRVPASGGVFAEGMVGSPQYLNPLLADNNPVDREITGLIFDGLTRYEKGQLVPALAESWEISEDGRTVLFTLRDDVIWHDGEPFTSADVAFTYGLLQDDDFRNNSALRRFWQSVTIRPVDEFQIAFELQEPYAGFLDTTTRGIMPAHMLEGVTAATLPDIDFNRQPVGTGPFIVESGQNWQQDRLLSLTPNPGDWREGSRIASLVFRFYADESSLLNAFEQGEVQAINSVSPAMLPEVTQLPQARLFTAVAPRYTTLLFNLTNGGSPATQSVEVRRALAHGLDREALVDDTLNGQGVLHTGPYLPASWVYNPDTLTLYDSQPISATTGLDAAGWTLAEGETMRRNGESAMVLRFLVFDTPTNRKLAGKIADEWTALGVAPQLTLFSDWRSYRQALRDRNFDVALVDVTPPGDPDLYDFWSQEAIIDGQNFAGWNRRRASEALEDGRRVWEIGERRPFYDSFLRYYNEDLPELSLFQHVYTYAVNEAVEGVEIGLIDHPRDRYLTMADWILLYRDVTVSCAEDQA